MSLLSCIFYKGYYFFLAYWFIELSRIICKILLDESDNSKSNDFSIGEEFFNLIFLNISDLLTGFLVLYTKIKMKPFKKKKIKKECKNSKNIESILIYNDFSYSHNYKYKYKYVLIILICFIDFVAKSDNFFSALAKIEILQPRQIDWLLSIDIIVRHIFSYKLLKIKIRRHHNLSIILCMFGFFLMWFFNIYNFFFP